MIYMVLLYFDNPQQNNICYYVQTFFYPLLYLEQNCIDSTCYKYTLQVITI